MNKVHIGKKEILQQRLEDAKSGLEQSSAHSLELLKESVSAANWVKRYPWQTMGAAAILGWGLAKQLLDGTAENKNISTLNTNRWPPKIGMGHIIKDAVSALVIAKLKKEFTKHYNENK